jgi:outer membrane scaffolding protein for murein synthesis (MipA/OmpV family)
MLALSMPVMAQSSRTNMPEGSSEKTLALATFIGPAAEGSAEQRFMALPLFSVRWSNGYFIRMNQIGLQLSDQPGLNYGLIGVPTFSRRTSLSGDGAPGKRKFTPELGGFLDYSVAHGISVSSSLLYGGSSDHRGLRLGFGGKLSMPVAEHHSLGLEASVSLANRAALQADFAVSPEQASAALPVHDVHGGVRSSAVGAHWRWAINHKYTLSNALEWRQLRGSAAASPRVEQAGGLALTSILSYSF